MTTAATITSSTPSAIHAVPTTAEAHAVPVQANVHVQAIGKLKLYVEVGGKRYSFSSENLTAEQQTKIAALESRLISGEQGPVTEASIDLDECLLKRGGQSSYLASSDPLVADFRALVKELLGVKALLWNTYLPGERTHVDAGKEKHYTNARLTELKPNKNDLVRALHETSLTDENPIDLAEQMKRMKRNKAAQHLMQASLAGLRKLKDELPPGELASQGRAQKIEEAMKAVQNLNSTAILFEATHPLDLSTIDPAKRMDALKKKQGCAKALIESREAPKKWDYLRSDTNPDEEQHYAAQLALNTYLGTREGYDEACLELNGEPSRDPLEGFFMRLSAEVAEGRNPEVLNDRLFNRLFEALNTTEKMALRAYLTAEAQRLSAAFQQLPVDGPDIARNHYRAGTTWSTLAQSDYQDALPNAFDREMTHLLRPQA